MRIRIEKVGVVPTGLPANKRENHVDGKDQGPGLSLPIEYTIEGELLGKLIVNSSVMVNRDTRNGVKMPGVFTTSLVTEVSETQFKTQNSVYNYKFI